MGGGGGSIKKIGTCMYLKSPYSLKQPLSRGPRDPSACYSSTLGLLVLGNSFIDEHYLQGQAAFGSIDGPLILLVVAFSNCAQLGNRHPEVEAVI